MSETLFCEKSDCRNKSLCCAPVVFPQKFCFEVIFLLALQKIDSDTSIKWAPIEPFLVSA